MLLLESHNEIRKFLDYHMMENYTINPDGTVDVDDEVSFRGGNMGSLPVRFGIVNGNFYCNSMGLETLEGCPKYVSGDFVFDNNKLTDLKGGPEKVDGVFNCEDNELTSLEGSAKYIGKRFYCSYNKLTDLVGSPEHVEGYFVCENNKLTSLKGSPKFIGGDFYCELNKIINLDGFDTKLVGKFRCKYNPISSVIGESEDMDFIKAFKVYKIITDGNKINFKRLKYLKTIFDFINDWDEMEKHYTIF